MTLDTPTWVAISVFLSFPAGAFWSARRCRDYYESLMKEMADAFGEAIIRSGPKCCNSISYHLNAIQNEYKQARFEAGCDVDGPA